MAGYRYPISRWPVESEANEGYFMKCPNNKNEWAKEWMDFSLMDPSIMSVYLGEPL